jgi:adenine-specific DNA-methyltransferase
VSLLKGLIQQATRPHDIVLDFFAGSGTTGQAVLELNAEDGGNRRFILCSSTEVTAKEPEKNVCRDVCAERMRRVMTGYGDKPGLGGSFAYLQLDATAPADAPFDVRAEHARTLLSLRLSQQALPPPAHDSAVQLIARGNGVDIVLCMEVTDAVIGALVAWPNARIAVYSPRPDTVSELLAVRGRDVNSYSLHAALVQGQARAKVSKFVAPSSSGSAA